MHLGFNQDEGKKIVFDGINPNIAVRQLAMHFPFASPSGAAAMYEPGREVQTWSSYTDEARHRAAASLLDRCTATNTCPKVFETFGASESWNLRGSIDLVGTKADKDIPLPANVRRYFFPGVTHGGGGGGFSTNMPGSAAGLPIAQQSESVRRYDARAHRRPGGLGDEGNATAGEPVSAPGSRRSGGADPGRAGFPDHPGRTAAG